MALNGQAYAVDLDRMRAAFGSKDERLLRSIAVLTEEISDEGEVASTAYSPQDAMADIIAGECRAPEDRRHLYGYAVEDLCHHFGEVIPIPDDEGFDEIGDPDDLEIEPRIFSDEMPIPVPAWDDTPYVRFLDASKVADTVARLCGDDLSHADPGIAEGRRILLCQLKWALDRGRAFVAVVNG
jgi:hypothetical protein